MLSTILILAMIQAQASIATPEAMCTCVVSDETTIEDDIASTDLIFHGVVLSKVPYPENWRDVRDEEGYPYMGFAGSEYVFFYASKIWKGSRLQDLVVATQRQDSMCGYDFEVGERYVVFANLLEAQPTTDICTRTKLSVKADADRQALDAYFSQE